MNHLSTNFSHLLVKGLGLNVVEQFTKILEKKYHYIRLSVYWIEIETEEGVYDFSSLHSLLKMAENVQQNIILTIGRKAIRWPEFFVPSWVKKDNEFTAFMQRIPVIHNELKNYTCITHIQVENEPLDPAGPDKRCIPVSELIEEIKLNKILWQKPIILTFWGNQILWRDSFKKLSLYADILGIHLYFQIPTGKWWFPYIGPLICDFHMRHIVRHCKKLIWCTELQIEPWGIKGIMNSIIKEKNIQRAEYMGFKEILLWGEEWEMVKDTPDLSYYGIIDTNTIG